ncbi:MAG: nuclear transport factor 2 family protein [Solirubrobacterales bacterium]
MTVSDSALAERIRRLEDRVELADLVAGYCHHLDDCNLDALGELFTEDITFGSSSGKGVTGRDKALKFIGERAAMEDWSFHYPHAQVFEITGEDEARGVITMHAEMGLDGNHMVVAAMRYNDAYQRVDGRWRFRRRTLQYWYCMESSDLVSTYDNANRKQWPYTAAADLPESLETWQALHPVKQPAAEA